MRSRQPWLQRRPRAGTDSWGARAQGSRLTPAADAWAGWAAWVRPLLLLGGARDGQMRFTRNVPWAAEAAVAAAKFGPRHAAAYKPFVYAPGAYIGLSNLMCGA